MLYRMQLQGMVSTLVATLDSADAIVQTRDQDGTVIQTDIDVIDNLVYVTVASDQTVDVIIK